MSGRADLLLSPRKGCLPRERHCALRKLRLPRLNDALPLALKSEYATQGLLDHVFGRGNASGCGVAAVVGAGRYDSDWLPVLVDSVPQRLVLILDSLTGSSAILVHVDGGHGGNEIPRTLNNVMTLRSRLLAPRSNSAATSLPITVADWCGGEDRRSAGPSATDRTWGSFSQIRHLQWSDLHKPFPAIQNPFSCLEDRHRFWP